ncbi:hypothetical protein GOBAR_AA00584 [Gossypium barbadense]|uniref:GH16 domain-containing protein n=1 Tax=Gossypium barbadense TaxID=3634 RepID=A0A2P5YWK9_GOSBA|nr:hypothetical protein GOBAR_AA00584 [Gossypium barbadense]
MIRFSSQTTCHKKRELDICSMRGDKDFDFTWGGKRGNVFNCGKLFSMSLDRVSGSGFQSMKECLFGRIAMQLKLGASTVIVFLIKSEGNTIGISSCRNVQFHEQQPANVAMSVSFGLHCLIPYVPLWANMFDHWWCSIIGGNGSHWFHLSDFHPSRTMRRAKHSLFGIWKFLSKVCRAFCSRCFKQEPLQLISPHQSQQGKTMIQQNRFLHEPSNRSLVELTRTRTPSALVLIAGLADVNSVKNKTEKRPYRFWSRLFWNPAVELTSG